MICQHRNNSKPEYYFQFFISLHSMTRQHPWLREIYYIIASRVTTLWRDRNAYFIITLLLVLCTSVVKQMLSKSIV